MEKFFPVPETTAPEAICRDVPEPLTEEQMEASLPHPVGHKILLALPQVDDKFEGSIIQKASVTVQNEQITTVIALVLEVGPDAYPADRFPGGPWCKQGDYVLIGPYKGQRLLLNSA